MAKEEDNDEPETPKKSRGRKHEPGKGEKRKGSTTRESISRGNKRLISLSSPSDLTICMQATRREFDEIEDQRHGKSNLIYRMIRRTMSLMMILHFQMGKRGTRCQPHPPDEGITREVHIAQALAGVPHGTSQGHDQGQCPVIETVEIRDHQPADGTVLRSRSGELRRRQLKKPSTTSWICSDHQVRHIFVMILWMMNFSRGYHM